MLSIGDYIKILLKKRGLTVAELARMMTQEERNHGSNTTIHRANLTPDINNSKISIETARKIEMALKLPKFQLVNMINPNLTKKQIELLENVYKIKSE